MDTTQVTDALDQLRTATQELQTHTSGLVRLVEGLPCDSWELLQLLDELAEADEDCSEHFVRFEEERGILHSESSQACKEDWTRCHNRRMEATGRVTRFAKALRMGQAEAA